MVMRHGQREVRADFPDGRWERRHRGSKRANPRLGQEAERERAKEVAHNAVKHVLSKLMADGLVTG